MNTESKKKFPVLTVVWDGRSYEFTMIREDVNQALGLAADHEFGLGLSDTQMAEISEHCGADVANSKRGDILRDVLDDLGVCYGGER